MPEEMEFQRVVREAFVAAAGADVEFVGADLMSHRRRLEVAYRFCGRNSVVSHTRQLGPFRIDDGFVELREAAAGLGRLAKMGAR